MLFSASRKFVRFKLFKKDLSLFTQGNSLKQNVNIKKYVVSNYRRQSNKIVCCSSIGYQSEYCSFDLLSFYVQVNSNGHDQMVSSHKYTQSMFLVSCFFN